MFKFMVNAALPIRVVKYYGEINQNGINEFNVLLIFPHTKRPRQLSCSLLRTFFLSENTFYFLLIVFKARPPGT